MKTPIEIIQELVEDLKKDPVNYSEIPRLVAYFYGHIDDLPENTRKQAEIELLEYILFRIKENS